MLCRGPNVALYTLNGVQLLEQRVCDEGDHIITSCSFYEGYGNEYLERELIFTGHNKGVTNVGCYGAQQASHFPLIFIGLATADSCRQIYLGSYQADEPHGQGRF